MRRLPVLALLTACGTDPGTTIPTTTFLADLDQIELRASVSLRPDIGVGTSSLGYIGSFTIEVHYPGYPDACIELSETTTVKVNDTPIAPQSFGGDSGGCLIPSFRQSHKLGLLSNAPASSTVTLADESASLTMAIDALYAIPGVTFEGTLIAGIRGFAQISNPTTIERAAITYRDADAFLSLVATIEPNNRIGFDVPVRSGPLVLNFQLGSSREATCGDFTACHAAQDIFLTTATDVSMP